MVAVIENPFDARRRDHIGEPFSRVIRLGVSSKHHAKCNHSERKPNKLS
jgi:hypothetical protein